MNNQIRIIEGAYRILKIDAKMRDVQSHTELAISDIECSMNQKKLNEYVGKVFYVSEYTAENQRFAIMHIMSCAGINRGMHIDSIDY